MFTMSMGIVTNTPVIESGSIPPSAASTPNATAAARLPAPIPPASSHADLILRQHPTPRSTPADLALPAEVEPATPSSTGQVEVAAWIGASHPSFVAFELWLCKSCRREAAVPI
ncbi:hypothetical protein ON010_g13279 [Phytophthora cinnamomi]|nr:hypothetical protein ON010_g13279 [Phytophthora cinnamomi]